MKEGDSYRRDFRPDRKYNLITLLYNLNNQ